VKIFGRTGVVAGAWVLENTVFIRIGAQRFGADVGEALALAAEITSAAEELKQRRAEKAAAAEERRNSRAQ
jgi:hypothetical protein